MPLRKPKRCVREFCALCVVLCFAYFWQKEIIETMNMMLNAPWYCGMIWLQLAQILFLLQRPFPLGLWVFNSIRSSVKCRHFAVGNVRGSLFGYSVLLIHLEWRVGQTSPLVLGDFHIVNRCMGCLHYIDRWSSIELAHMLRLERLPPQNHPIYWQCCMTMKHWMAHGWCHPVVGFLMPQGP